jgi:two-component system, OmpR family, phosphate regulon sensor histidine kinase PhoR
MSVSNSASQVMEPINSVPANEALLEVLATSREGILVVREDTRIIASNTAAREAFGRGTGALEGKRLSEIIRNLDLHEAFHKALQENTSSDIKLETTAQKRKYDVHIAPIKLEDAQHAIGFFYDITQIERLETVRQEFLSNISHELRTPLTSIMAFVETLEDGAIDDHENNRRFLKVIRKNAGRMHELIADILELSLIESGSVSVNIAPVRLRIHVEEVFASLSKKAVGRDVKLINEVAAGTVVSVDPVRLEQMLTNLIDNAIKFNREGGNVTVAHERAPGKDIVSVADTGEGILSDHLVRIFERFYRADRARSREIGGTGLGLAIVKHLARVHGGEVSVESVLSRGTTFFVELPIK